MKKLIIVSMVLFCCALNATDYEITVCNLQTHNDSDNTYVEPCGGWTSKSNCPSGDWITWDMSKFQGKAMYSSAMSALTTGKKIKVRLQTSNCTDGYDVTTMIRISNQK